MYSNQEGELVADYDLIIRNGSIVDGSGAQPFSGDVGIREGLIAAVGEQLSGTADREIDATGLVVTPGFVDIHTHYDGQATWGTHMAPSSNLGATTVVMGNCGVGFAPCRPDDRDALIELMEGVEEIPDVVMAEGLPWNWESFTDYLDAVDARSRDVDVAALFPHGPLRVYVMGQRALDREAATDQDIAAMKALLEEGMDAGAVGFSTSRTLVHRTLAGVPVPTYDAATAELKQLGESLSGARGHVMQMVADWKDPDEEFSILSHTSEVTGAKGTFTLLDIDAVPGQWREHLQRIEASQSRGLNIQGQVLARPLGMMMGLSGSMTPFTARPTMRALEELPFAERLKELAKPEVKSQILSEKPQLPHVFMHLFGNRHDIMFPMEEPLEYLPDASRSVAIRAAAAGVEAESWLYDYFLEDEGKSLIYLPSVNFSEHIPELLGHPNTIPALGDGGAHVGSICDASANIYLLTKWVRDAQVFTLEEAIHKLTRKSAELYSLYDRGLLEPGMKADINLIDFGALALQRPHIVYDLPSGGKRFQQDAQGLVATLVAGEEIYRDGEPTGALPGKLVRGQQGQQTTA
ncbi:MAG: N-acyl-D-amino-acid deacylase family protein [Pseudomonadales bacterium]